MVESGAPTTVETKNGKIPLWFATAEGNLIVVSYLIKQDHDAYSLLSDRKVFQTFKNIKSLPILSAKLLCQQFVYNLMACGKKSNNAPTEEFILASPAPVDVAAKISAIYRELSEKVSLFLIEYV